MSFPGCSINLTYYPPCDLDVIIQPWCSDYTCSGGIFVVVIKREKRAGRNQLRESDLFGGTASGYSPSTGQSQWQNLRCWWHNSNSQGQRKINPLMPPASASYSANFLPFQALRAHPTKQHHLQWAGPSFLHEGMKQLTLVAVPTDRFPVQPDLGSHSLRFPSRMILGCATFTI